MKLLLRTVVITGLVPVIHALRRSSVPSVASSWRNRSKEAVSRQTAFNLIARLAVGQAIHRPGASRLKQGGTAASDSAVPRSYDLRCRGRLGCSRRRHEVR